MDDFGDLDFVDALVEEVKQNNQCIKKEKKSKEKHNVTNTLMNTSEKKLKTNDTFQDFEDLDFVDALVEEIKQSDIKTEKSGKIKTFVDAADKQRGESARFLPDSILNLQPVEFQKLKCLQCLQNFENPATLPCGHTFCLNCIQIHASMNAEKKNQTPLICPYPTCSSKIKSVVPNLEPCKILSVYCPPPAHLRNRIDVADYAIATGKFEILPCHINQLNGMINHLLEVKRKAVLSMHVADVAEKNVLDSEEALDPQKKIFAADMVYKAFARSFFKIDMSNTSFDKAYEVILICPPFEQLIEHKCLHVIKKMPIIGIAAKDSIVLVRCQDVFIDFVIEAMTAWGFEYKCIFLQWHILSDKNKTKTPSVTDNPKIYYYLAGSIGTIRQLLHLNHQGKATIIRTTELEEHPNKLYDVLRSQFDRFNNKVEIFNSVCQPTWDNLLPDATVLWKERKYTKVDEKEIVEEPFLKLRNRIVNNKTSKN